MILKKSKKTNLYFSLFFFIFINIIIFSQLNFSKYKVDLIQYVMSLDLGFSHRMNLIDDGSGIFNNGLVEGDKKYRKEIIPTLIKSVPRIIYYKLFGIKFEKIFIDIDFENFQSLLNDKNKALNNKGLMNSNFVSGEIKYNNKKYPAKFKLKGDLVSHYNSSYRMSLRVHLKKGNTINGLSRFSIQKPAERQFPYDHTFQKEVRNLKILSPDNHYYHVFINGTSWGVMNFEEHMNKILLEKQKRKESLILRFGNDINFLFYDNNSNLRVSDPNLFINIYQDKIADDLKLRRYYSYIYKKINSNENIIFDKDKLSKTFLLSSLWGNYHTIYNNNSRYYFNPYTLKLEPITTDQGAIKLLSKQKNYTEADFPKQYFNLINSEYFRQNYFENLIYLNKNILLNKNIFDETNKIFPIDRKKNDLVLRKNFEYLNSKFIDLNKFKKIENKTKLELDHNLLDDFVYLNHYKDGRIEIYNLLPNNVKISKILYNNINILGKSFNLKSINISKLPHVINTGLKGIFDQKISIVAEYDNTIKTTTNDVTLETNEVFNPLSNLSKNDAFYIKEGKYHLKKGKWNFQSPIVLDKDLVIKEGTHLNFSSNSYLIVKGSINALGKKNQPIVMNSIDKDWKGIYVLEAKNKSVLNYVEIRNTNYLIDGILNLTGAINFYKSKVDIFNTKILNSNAEDALNIINSDFNINGISIINARSDGIDFDFSNGQISNSKFIKIGGDAIDFSGSYAIISNTVIDQVYDKGISVGEQSNIEIDNVSIKNSNIGIVSKDSSKTFINDSEIKNIGQFSLMTFKKKNIFNYPYLEIKNSKFELNKTINQNGSTFIYDGKILPSEEFDINLLYN